MNRTQRTRARIGFPVSAAARAFAAFLALSTLAELARAPRTAGSAESLLWIDLRSLPGPLPGLALLAASTVLLAYAVRFHAGIPAPLGVPPIEPYVQALEAILPIWFWLFRSHGLYEPRRTGSLLSEAGQLVRATAVGVAVLLALAFFYRDFSYSRGVVVLFSVLSPVMVLGLRVGLRVALRRLRRRREYRASVHLSS